MSSSNNRLNHPLGLGATGKFPRGKARPGDEGELRAAVAVRGATVMIDFGKPIAWLAMSAAPHQVAVGGGEWVAWRHAPYKPYTVRARLGSEVFGAPRRARQH